MATKQNNFYLRWQKAGQRERPSFRKVKNSFMGLTLQTLLQKQKDSTK
jgi:hypothetical protein